METSRYLMTYPELDPLWETHVNSMVDFVTWALVDNNQRNEPGIQWGARVVSEQRADENRMVSHTSRYVDL